VEDQQPFEPGALVRRTTEPVRFPRPLTQAQRWIRDETNAQLDEITGNALVARHFADHARGLAEYHQSAFAQGLETLGTDLDRARRKHGSDQSCSRTASGNAVQFRGSEDIPALLTAFTRDNVTNLGSGLLASQQLVHRNMVEVVNRSLTPPEEARQEPKKGGFFSRLMSGSDD
jgi:hypothetical protein